VLRLYVKILVSYKSFRDRLSLSGEICQELMRQIGGKVWWGLGKIDLRENSLTRHGAIGIVGIPPLASLLSSLWLRSG
jgi:hypothetical protein